MEIIYILIGIIIGISIIKIINNFQMVIGVIEVDHESNLCRIRISRPDLSDFTKTKAVFKICHNATIRENNTDYNE